ncbi:MAG TPA: hypothetical protein VIY48_18730 [Candidatus Paceibacterota bacterium]
MAVGKVILYFIKDSYPTPEEFVDAARYGTKMFRNASIADNEYDTTEVCDGVAGSVPERYKKYPLAEPVVPSTPPPQTPNGGGGQTQPQGGDQPWAKK